MKTLLLWLLPLSLFVAPVIQAENLGKNLYKAAEKLEQEGIHLRPEISIGATIEAEGSVARQNNETHSDLVLATVEAWLEAELAEGVRAEIVALWEQDDTEPAEIDTAIVELGGTATFPFCLTVGRMYLPFGAFNSFMVSDPLTLELGETRQDAAALLYEDERWSFWFGVFEGEREDANDLENGVIALSLTPWDWLTVGTSYSTDIIEGAGYLEDFNDAGLSSKTPGVSAHLLLEYKPVTIAVEYLGACDKLVRHNIEDESLAERPHAWHVDCTYTLSENWTAALRYEGSQHFKADQMPEHQAGTTFAWTPLPCTTISLEYLYGTFAEEEVDQRHLLTGQLAIEF